MIPMNAPSKQIAVWTTKRCNKHCRYCFYEGTDVWESHDHMTIETAKEVCKFINAGLATKISFFGGEPLVNWPIMKFILEHTAHKRKVKFYVTTNGTLLTPEIMAHLGKYKVGIALSIDGTRETHNTWRDGSYDAIIKNLPLLLSHQVYNSVNILKTMATPDTFYEDIKHIQSLGFKKMFSNILDPYSPITYEGYSTEDFKDQYRRAVKDFNGEGEGKIKMNDFSRWSKLIKQVHDGKKKTGCGFLNRGLSIGVEGGLYPCLQTPSFPYFKVGDLWNGIDFEKRASFQKENLEKTACNECEYKFNKCPETMYRLHGKFGVNPPRWYAEFEIAKIEVIEDLLGLPHLETACQGGKLF